MLHNFSIVFRSTFRASFRMFDTVLRCLPSRRASSALGMPRRFIISSNDQLIVLIVYPHMLCIHHNITVRIWQEICALLHIFALYRQLRETKSYWNRQSNQPGGKKAGKGSKSGALGDKLSPIPLAMSPKICYSSRVSSSSYSYGELAQRQPDWRNPLSGRVFVWGEINAKMQRNKDAKEEKKKRDTHYALRCPTMSFDEWWCDKFMKALLRLHHHPRPQHTPAVNSELKSP